MRSVPDLKITPDTNNQLIAFTYRKRHATVTPLLHARYRDNGLK